MKKIGLICLTLVLALGALGIGYAHWQETLTMSGTATTDDIDPYFDCLLQNDYGTNLDPAGWGAWNYGTGLWEGTRRAKHVGQTCVGGLENTLTMTVTNAYPSYYGSVAYCVKNRGSVPVNVHTIKLTHLSGPLNTRYALNPAGGGWELATNTRYYIDVETAGVSTTSFGAMVDDFSLIVSTIAVGQQLDPSSWSNRTPPPTPVLNLNGDLSIHMENGCQETATYDFTVAVEFWNWPE